MVDYHINNKFGDAFKGAAIGVSIGERNQLAEFAKVLRGGAQMAEIDIASVYGLLNEGGNSAVTIGKAEREAIGHLAEATKADLSIHAPWAINFSGINPQSGEKDAQYGNLVTNEVREAVKFADDVSQNMGKKNMPIIFHASSDHFGSPDKSAGIMAYDNSEEKVVPIKSHKYSMDLKQFADIYGDDTLQTLKKVDGGKGVQEVSAQDDRNKKYVVLSPSAELEFLKVQYRKNLNQELVGMETSKYNLGLQRRELLNELAAANIKGDLVRIEQLSKNKEAIDQMEKQLEVKKKEIGLQANDLNNRFLPFDERAPSLAAVGIKNAALESMKTKTRPMILVENTMTPDMSLSNPAETAKSVQIAREMFVGEVAKKYGMSTSEAKALSEELIGINLDIGHANVFKSYINPQTGKPYSDKDIVEMSLAAKDYIKRYHLNDNMGSTDAHLPLGEGNAPVKEIYEALRKAGVEAPAIMEVFGGLGGSDVGFSQSLQYIGAPIYGDVPYVSLPSYAGQPYSSLMGDYSSYSNLGLKNDMFPYGGFSGIFPALGGGYMENNKGGGGFSGAPMV